ncbi:hypothetical protein GCM10020000_38120 [Streptomyces olivoverticillatus]
MDQANRLHFYVLNVQRDASGVLSYDIGVKSLDGTGPAGRGLALGKGTAKGRPADGRAVCTFDLANTGRTASLSDIYRLSATVSGRGWSAWLPNRLTTARAGTSVTVPVAVSATKGAERHGKITLTARSESDPGRTATATCTPTKQGS